MFTVQKERKTVSSIQMRKMSFPQFTLLLYAIIHALTFLKFSLGADTLFPDQKIVNGQTLISQNQIFEMGFFSPGTSIKGFLGIWYKSTSDIVVWVANRNNPMPDSQGVLLSIARNGTLVISRGGGIIWSSNSSGSASHPILQLLDTGNLVVMDNANKSSYIWQSFDYPTDTRLPGMKMVDDPATGEEKYLTSWRSPDDPTPGDFVYKIENQGLAEMVMLRVGMKRYRTGPWNGLYMSGAPPRNQPFFKSNAVFKNDILTYILEPYNSSNIYRTTMEQSGFVQRYRMNERRNEWNIVLTLPFDPCDYYAQCGPYGVCNIEKEPICKCLKGFAQGRQRDWDWSDGCTRIKPLNCENGDGFLEVKAVKFPDMLKFWLNTSMNLSECRGECLKNCNCTAYANPYLTNGGSGCLMWFGDLIDIREIPAVDSRQIMYIRLPVSELESDNNLHERKKKKKPGKLIRILAAAGVLVSCLICLVMLVTIRHKRRSIHNISRTRIRANRLPMPVFTSAAGRKNEDLELPSFKLATIAVATNNFSSENMLGQGGFGPVYKGNLLEGEEIAVKRLSKTSGQGLEEFKSEVVLIAKLQHRNLVRLLGCCVEGDERLLIYEYMQNRSLDYFVFGTDENRTLLTWPKRFHIIMGITRGLLYLHQDSRLKIIHRDLKTSNILLDGNLNAKISDFGLARSFGDDQTTDSTKRVVGTFGYMAPEYAIEGNFSMKSDIFSMGVILLEIVSGKKNRGFNHHDHRHGLLGHAWLLWKENKAMELMDECMNDTCIEPQVKRCIQVGLLCVQNFAEHRPVMSSVLFMLASEGAVLPEPKEPGFFMETSSNSNVEDYVDISTSKESKKGSMTITDLEPR